MKILFSKIIVCAIIFLITSGSYSQSEFELVESVPVETTLEQSQLPRALDVWIKMISNAKESIDIETFYFANENGQSLEQVMTAIKAAAQRGVKIRIMVDSSFYSGSEKSIDALNDIENITIKKIPFGNLAGGVMHAKYFIVDNENLFLGSQNMDWRALIHIHEVGARVKDKDLARTFHELFETDWALCDGNIYGLANQKVNFFVSSAAPVTISSGLYGKIILYPAFSPAKLNMAGLSSEEEELLKVISNTKDSLDIQMYSYTTKARNETNFYGAIDSALKNAAARGVKIKIIFSDWAIRDVATENIKELSQVSNIQIKFSSIPQYSGGFIPYSRVEHCKYFTADNNISWISTANWEYSYFNNSRNATLIIDNMKINKALNEVFYRSWDSPYANFVDVNKKYEAVKRK